MKIQIRIDQQAGSRIRDLAGRRLDAVRKELVHRATTESLQSIIEENPVATGRSRAAWVASLEQLGGEAPAGWQGAHPSAIDQGKKLGSATRTQSPDQTQIEATNAVSYVPYLEYGTSRMAPFAMVRRSLFRIASQLAGWFRF